MRTTWNPSFTLTQLLRYVTKYDSSTPFKLTLDMHFVESLTIFSKNVTLKDVSLQFDVLPSPIQLLLTDVSVLSPSYILKYNLQIYLLHVLLLQFFHYELQVDTQDLHTKNNTLLYFRIHILLTFLSISSFRRYSSLLTCVRKRCITLDKTILKSNLSIVPSSRGKSSIDKYIVLNEYRYIDLYIRSISVSILIILFHIRQIWNEVTSTQFWIILLW